MTANKRIFLNIVATYGRSLFALLCGLFTARWTLQSLGEVDYGLYGVVGGLTAFIAFFNGILATSVGRFYAFSVGRAQIVGKEAEGLTECQRWFTVAVTIHFCVALILIVIGHPLGEWAVRNWLTIPPDRIEACVWVWRFVCLTCFLSMATVPFNAMYTAKQYIAELTVYSFVTTTLNVCFLYYMVEHPGVWLTKYAFWSMLLALIPNLIISVRAISLFEECRIKKGYLFHWASIKHLACYSGWNFFGAMGNLLKSAGMTVLVNKFLGPAQNAAVAIANNVSGHAQSLSGALVGAFMPAITNACGAGERERMIKLIHTTCKFGAVSLLPFMLPLALEIEEVMILWLKTPPAGTGSLCLYIFVTLILEKLTTGHWVAIAANGKIAKYQMLVGTCFIATLPIAALMMYCGLGIQAVGLSLLTTLSAVVIIRLIALKRLLSISPRYWIFKICIPLSAVVVIVLGCGVLPQLWMSPSFMRICVTGIICEMVLLPLVWLCIFDTDERYFVQMKLINRFLRKKIHDDSQMY